MISGYKEERWIEAFGHKEGGKCEEYLFSCDFGKVKYKFILKIVGEIDGIKYYDIASYRGAAGPYIVEVEEGKEKQLIELYIDDFSKYCIQNNIIAEFAKLDPWDQYAELIRETLQAEYYGNYYCNDLTRDFWKQDYNRNAKRGVKKAIAGGVKVEFDFEGKTISQFIELYKNTENKFNTSDYYRFTNDDIRKVFDVYKEDAFLINAVMNHNIITSVLVIMGPEIAHYLFLGSDANPEYSKLQANCLLTYETSLYCQKKGKKLLDMGGGKSGGGIERFKRNFISDDGVWKYYVLKKIHNPDIYNRFVARKKEIKNDKFFPLYRG